MKVLWLASWYPNALNPYDGDFVQRHARAVSAFVPLTVIYVSQAGTKTRTRETTITENKEGALTEIIVLFKFFKTGIGLLDKLLYNIRYYAVYKKLVREHFQKEGRPDMLHVHIPIKAGLIARWIKLRWEIPYIVSEQSSHYYKYTADSFHDKKLYHRNNVRKIFRDAERVTNVSAIVGKMLKSLFGLREVHTIHNTVNTELFYYKPVAPGKKFRFIHVSTLKEHQKNSSGMLKAIAKLMERRRDFEVVVVGPATESLKELVLTLNIELFVQFTGELSYPDVAAAMQKADAFVLFSNYENFPCVIVEALCCGLPIVSSDTGGIAEAVNESNGLLVEPQDEQALAQSMKRMIDEYAMYNRPQIAAAAKEKYNYAAIGGEFYALYNSLLKKD